MISVSCPIHGETSRVISVRCLSHDDTSGVISVRCPSHDDTSGVVSVRGPSHDDVSGVISVRCQFMVTNGVQVINNNGQLPLLAFELKLAGFFYSYYGVISVRCAILGDTSVVITVSVMCLFLDITP